MDRIAPQKLSLVWHIGTLVVNVLGCFVIGVLSYLADARGLFTPEARALAITGFLGGFTTFSTPKVWQL